MQNLIKTIDFKLYDSSLPVFAEEMKSAFLETGFFLLTNHSVSFELLQKNRALLKKFFKELSLEQRMKYSFEDMAYQKGYTPMSIETGEFSTVPDNKHFYQLGDMYDNPLIEELPGFKETTEELYQQFFGLGKKIMQGVAVSLNRDKEFFTHQLGNSIMRHIHYPAHDNPMIDENDFQQGGNVLPMCASKHTGINDITLLHATEPGLQLDHKGKWVPVLCNPDTIIVNVGDMLWYLTGGKYKSGIHRVVCQPGIERFSSPFFLHSIDESSIVPLADLGEYDKNIFTFKTEGEFLRHRLEQINLKKKVA